MIRRVPVLGSIIGAGLLAAPVQGQIAPGVRLPSNITDAVMMAHLFSCVGAATDRPANGLNIPLAPDATGVALHKELPTKLRDSVGKMPSEAKFLSLSSPEGDAWVAFDPLAKRCVVTAVVSDPASVKRAAVDAMNHISLPRLNKPAVRDASNHELPTYDWDIAATPRLGTPAVQLRVVIDADGSSARQIALISTATKAE
jgi:hypothetical protein